jgi:hypothetical protein
MKQHTASPIWTRHSRWHLWVLSFLWGLLALPATYVALMLSMARAMTMGDEEYSLLAELLQGHAARR